MLGGSLPPLPDPQYLNVSDNPLFEPCNPGTMEEPLPHSLSRLLAPTQSSYGGESGPPFYEWQQERLLALSQQVAKSLAANRAQPHPSVLIQELTMNCAPRSQLQTFLREGARLFYPSIVAAADEALFPSTDLTQQMRALALGVHAGQPEYEARLRDLLAERLEPLAAQARAQNRLADAQGARLPAPTAAADGGGEPAAVNPPAAGAAADQPAPTRAILDPNTAQLYTPGLAVATKLLLLAEVRFGTATRQQEVEFKTIKQKPTESYRDFAYRLQLLERTVAHRTNYTAGYKATLYIAGLADRGCAAWVSSQMMVQSAASQTVDRALLLAEAYEECGLERQQVQLDIEAARRAAGSSQSARQSKPSTQSSGDRPLTDAQIVKEMSRMSRQLTPDHDLAPCTLHGPQCRHTNASCRAPEHPRNRGKSAGAPWQQRSSARSSSAEGTYGSRPGTAGMAMGSYYSEPTAAAAAAGPPQAFDPRAQGPRAQGPDCRWCHRPGGHGGGPCYIHEPHLAPPHWRPPGQVPHTSSEKWQHVLEYYRHKCAQLGVCARPPTQGGARGSPPGSPRGSASSGPGSAAARGTARDHSVQSGGAARGGSDGRGSSGADLHAAVAYGDAELSLGGWWDAGACIMATPVAAGVTTRSRQPRSFVAPDNLSPPAHLTRPAAAEADAPAADKTLGATNGDAQVQITLTLPVDKGARLLSELAAAGAGTTSANAGLALASNSTHSKVRLQGVIEGNTTSQQNGRCSSSAGIDSSCISNSIPSERGAAQLVLGELADTLLMGKDPQRLVSEYMAASETPGMHAFTGTTPAQGVSVQTSDGRLVLIPHAVEDTGCVPTIMTAHFAKQAGIHWQPFEPGQAPRVRDIAGKTADFVGVTQPFALVLASGTPDEVRLDQPQGCLVMGGDAAAAMYDVVVGRKALLSVAGYVHPLTRQFVYCPNLRSNDLRTNTLPVRLGVPRASQPASAGSAADCSPFLCAAIAQDAEQEALEGHACAPQPGWLDGSVQTLASLVLFLLFLANGVSNWRLLRQALHARTVLVLCALGTACLISFTLLRQAASLAARLHAGAPGVDSLLHAPLHTPPPDDRGDMLAWAHQLATFRGRC